MQTLKLHEEIRNGLIEGQEVYDINGITKDGYTREFVDYINKAANGKRSEPMTAEENFKLLGI